MHDSGARPLHPGRILRESIMASYVLPADEVSDATGISVREIADLAAERTALTLATALKLAAYSDTSAEGWLRMQSTVDAWEAARVMAEELAAIEPFDTNRGIWADREPLPPELVEQLHESCADLDDPRRYLIRSSFDGSSEWAAYYDVESDCWATDLPSGTRFKRRWAAEKVLEGRADEHHDVVEINIATNEEILAHRVSLRQERNFRRLKPDGDP
ncbi:MAG: HigA family addiction module antitoxin [Actinomycetota bacterium]|nr:HigA family addiction module antitoxin [Actinomycetota bacterium]